MSISDEEVRWAYRLILEREPENDAAVERSKQTGSVTKLRQVLLTSREYLKKHPDPLRGAPERRIVIAEFGGTLRLYVDLNDPTTAAQIVLGNFGRLEEALLRRLVRVGDRVVDVGADSGFFTILLASLVGPSGRVSSFEPLKSRADLIKRSIAENAFEDRVVLDRLAIANGHGFIRVASSPVAFQSIDSPSTVLLRHESDEVPMGFEVAPATMTCLDDHDFGSSLALVTVGSSGVESLMVSGAQKTLTTKTPNLLIRHDAAALQRSSGHTLMDVNAQLQSLGYTGYHVLASQLKDLDPTPKRFATLLFVHRQNAAVVEMLRAGET